MVAASAPPCAGTRPTAAGSWMAYLSISAAEIFFEPELVLHHVKL